ncbi:hypothetical protein ACFSC6_12260 [Rufibacter sediminis]|uniref:Head-tail adaptor protein n=1 Tax=Rufibacter sediminis TaxID=2762756 RepID=A0ABR6VU24_9BACT|nr:hypothetical protein [Rufibacter sediminis]MBC3540656.1 hypothetical protein [Rufibacter sediminis]
MTLKRKPLGSYVDGVWIEGNPVATTILASVQPAKPEDLQSLPENRRALATYKVYTDAELFGVLEGVRNPDILVIYGEDYEIAQVGIWQNGLVNHYKALAVRVQP